MENQNSETKKRLHNALSTVIEVEKMYEELKEEYDELKEKMKKTVLEGNIFYRNKYIELKKEYADLRGKFTKLSRDNKVQIAETNWLDALVTYHRDGQHEEDKEAVNELQDEFYEVRKEVATRNKADKITSDKIL